MHIKQIKLVNFRNYPNAELSLHAGLNVLVGENAQGKTNFLEAIELLSTGHSSRTTSEYDFIMHGKENMRIEMFFEARGVDESLALSIEGGLEKKRIVQVNGIKYALLKKLRGRLTTVTFNSYDLNLLRGGPAFRRDWIDAVIIRLKPSFYEQLSKYQKIVLQRNRLLKNMAENQGGSQRDIEQLDVWSEQVAKYGAHIIVKRRKTLYELLGRTRNYLSLISDQNETLSIMYRCQSLQSRGQNANSKPKNNYYEEEIEQPSDNLLAEEEKIEKNLLYSLRQRRMEEIVRKQTLSGPHRDDVIFLLNEKEATSFASQGQQRSLVLALKLSELDLIRENLLEPPVLLLDDVLAELDLKRQSLLMSQINEGMQTIISTTHVSNFNANWLDAAHFYEVRSGTIKQTESQAAIR